MQRTIKINHFLTKPPINNWHNEVNWQVLKTNKQTTPQMTNTYFSKSSTSLASMEMQIKTTRRHHPTPGRMAIIRRVRTDAGEDIGKEFMTDGSTHK